MASPFVSATTTYLFHISLVNTNTPQHRKANQNYPLIRQLEKKQLVQNHTQTPHIRLWVNLLQEPHVWGGQGLWGCILQSELHVSVIEWNRKMTTVDKTGQDRMKIKGRTHVPVFPERCSLVGLIILRSLLSPCNSCQARLSSAELWWISEVGWPY